MEIPDDMLWREGAKIAEYRIRVAPNTVAYADAENHKLVAEFAIPGAPTDTIDVKILEDSVHLRQQFDQNRPGGEQAIGRRTAVVG